jgi:hypothetical protein
MELQSEGYIKPYVDCMMPSQSALGEARTPEAKSKQMSGFRRLFVDLHDEVGVMACGAGRARLHRRGFPACGNEVFDRAGLHRWQTRQDVG